MNFMKNNDNKTQKKSIMDVFGSLNSDIPFKNVQEIRNEIRDQIIAEKYGNQKKGDM
ncbi:hypothetical protein D3C80_1810520 [compost metagenome]